MSNRNITGLTTAGLLAGLLAAVSAGAQNSNVDRDAPQVAVRYQASQLESDQGVRQVYAQLQRAAKEVCPQSSASALPSPGVIACRQQAVAMAITQIHNARLAALAEPSMKHG